MARAAAGLFYQRGCWSGEGARRCSGVGGCEPRLHEVFVFVRVVLVGVGVIVNVTTTFPPHLM